MQIPTYCIVDGCPRPEAGKIGRVPYCKKHLARRRPADATGLVLAYYICRQTGRPIYASDTPKPPGDWTTTPNRLFALPLNRYWLRRWEKYCHDGRDAPHSLPWTNP